MNLANISEEIIGYYPMIKTALIFLIGFLSGSGVIGVCLNFIFKKKLQKAQHDHEKEMEKIRQDYDEKVRQQPKQIAIDRLKSRLERFVSCWEEDKESILEEREKERKKKLREKLIWIGNELNEEAEVDKKLISLIIEEGVRDIGDGIINLSSKIAHEPIVVNEDKGETKQRHQKIVEKGDKLIERAKELIGELQQEGEEEKGGKEDE